MPQPTAKSTKNIGIAGTNHPSLSFLQALTIVQRNKAASRESWDNPALFIHMHKGQVCVRLDDGLDHPLIVSQEDMEGDDWFEVPKPTNKVPGIDPATTPPLPPAGPADGIDPRDKPGVDT